MDIRPEDSVSAAGSRPSRSSSSVPIKQLKAKKAFARLKVKQLLEEQELLRKQEEIKMERQILEAKYELKQAALQVKILEEDHSGINGAIPKMSKQSGSSLGEFNSKGSKRDGESKVKDVGVETKTKDDLKNIRSDNDVI